MKYGRSIDIPFKKITKDEICDVYRLLVEFNENNAFNVNVSFDIYDKISNLKTQYNSFEEFYEDILHGFVFDIIVMDIHGQDKENMNNNTHIQFHYRGSARWFNISINGSSKAWVDEVSRTLVTFFGIEKIIGNTETSHVNNTGIPLSSEIVVATDKVSKKYMIIGLWIAGITLVVSIVIPILQYFAKH